MDSLSFDGYTSYSDTSTPRTPSPSDMSAYPPNIKHDIDQPIRNINIFNPHPDDDHHSPVVVPQDNHYWPNGNNNFGYNNHGHQKGPFVADTYNEHDSLSPDYSPETPFNVPSSQWDPHQNNQRSGDIATMRRATFPYVRQDREEGMPAQQYPNMFQGHQQHPHQQSHHHHQQQMNPHGHHHQLNAYPQRQEGPYGDAYLPSSSPHASYRDYDDSISIKLEDSNSMMIPQQNNFYRPHSNSSAGIPGHPPMPTSLSYLSPHSGIPVQHTDDAASKETQYLRRRCFNCHTTEPPSWRRSTLNPGKIVCNKCGLYERTHLRPRPLRFDELRAGNKARKGSKSAAAAGAGGAVSPKQGKMNVKREGGLVRRSSVSSNSSVHSSSGASDWDDNVSVYSSGSAPPTTFPSPVSNNFPLSRDSQSPPRDSNGSIRLPSNPLSDLASMHGQGQAPSTTTPLLPPPARKSHNSPTGYYSPSLSASTMPPVAENAVWSAEPEATPTIGDASNGAAPNSAGLLSRPNAS